MAENIENIELIKIIETNDNGSILINLREYIKDQVLNSYPFYNGGWIKLISGLDKTKTNGYSHLGKFVNDGSIWYKPNTPIVICDIGGSRKNQIRYYYLISINKDGVCTIHNEKSHSRSYATDFWAKIEELLSVSNQKIEVSIAQIINTTPHDITILNGDEKIVFEKSDNPIRLEEIQKEIGSINGIPIYRKKFNSADLPEFKENVFYIVSLVVAQTFSNRKDLLIVNDTIRNEKGQIVGAKSFARI